MVSVPVWVIRGRRIVDLRSQQSEDGTLPGSILHEQGKQGLGELLHLKGKCLRGSDLSRSCDARLMRRAIWVVS
jgi:hypothetical protein